MGTPLLISSLAWAWRSWWMPIAVPAAAQYFFHRLCAASYDSGPPPAVDAGAEQRARGIPGPGQVQLEQRHVAPVIEQHGSDGAALAVHAGVLVVRAQVQVLDVHPADLRGARRGGARCARPRG